MVGMCIMTGLLALVIVSVFKETAPLRPKVFPPRRDRNIPKENSVPYYTKLLIFFKRGTLFIFN
jgi:hypothetical protein